MDRKIRELEGKNFDKILGKNSNVGKRLEFIILGDANPKYKGGFMDKKHGKLTKIGEARVKQLDLLTGGTGRRLRDGEWVDDVVGIKTFTAEELLNRRLSVDTLPPSPRWRLQMGLDK